MKINQREENLNDFFYSPDNYFLISDINNGDNVYTIGYRISIYKVLPYDLKRTFTFPFVPQLTTVSTKIARIGKTGGKILVADSDETIAKRSKLIKDNSSKHIVQYVEPNHDKIYKELVQANYNYINNFATNCANEGLTLNKESFGYEMSVDKEGIPDYNGRVFAAHLGYVVNDLYSSEYFGFDNYLSIGEHEKEYFPLTKKKMNCYILEFVDSYNVTTRGDIKGKKVKKLEKFLKLYNYGDIGCDTLIADANNFFSLRNYGIPLDFLFEFEPGKCVYAIVPVYINENGKEYGPLFHSFKM